MCFVCFWSLFCSICLYVYSQANTAFYLDRSKSESVWKSGSASLPTLFIVIIVLVIIGLLRFHISFVTSLPISTKKPTGTLIGIVLTLQISLETVDILPGSTHLVHKFQLHLFISSFINLSNVRSFLCYCKWYFLNCIFLLFVAGVQTSS